MTYFAPDTLEWEAMEMGHSGWVSWLLSGRMETFYDGMRWPGRREEAAALHFEHGVSVYPFLWSEEAHADLAATSRRPVPMREVLGVAADFGRQTGSSDPGFLGDVRLAPLSALVCQAPAAEAGQGRSARGRPG